MKKLMLLAVMVTAFFGKAIACVWDDADDYFYNLFTQEIMNDPRYKPFLFTYDRYYPHEAMRSGNIEEWQRYLGLSYEDTRYLVFESTRDDLQKLTKGKAAADKSGKIIVRNICNDIRNVFMMTGFLNLFEIQ